MTFAICHSRQKRKLYTMVVWSSWPFYYIEMSLEKSISWAPLCTDTVDDFLFYCLFVCSKRVLCRDFLGQKWNNGHKVNFIEMTSDLITLLGFEMCFLKCLRKTQFNIKFRFSKKATKILTKSPRWFEISTAFLDNLNCTK